MLYCRMFPNQSDFDSSSDSSALKDLGSDGSFDAGSIGCKRSLNNNTMEGRTDDNLLKYFVPWDAPKDMSGVKDEDEADFIDNRIYISNIPFSYTSVDLEKIFAKFGKVLAAQVVTNERGSKGFGFVTLDTAEGCNLAREQLDGSIMGGRKIEVKKARQMQHSRIVPMNAQMKFNGTARSLLSPSLTASFTNDIKGLSTMNAISGGMANFNGLPLQTPNNGAAAQLIAQLQLAQSLQTAQLINLLASQPNVGNLNPVINPSFHSFHQQNGIMNSFLNPLAMATPMGVSPFTMDASTFLRSNASMPPGGIVPHSTFPNTMDGTSGSSSSSSLFPSLDASTISLDAISFLSGGMTPSSNVHVMAAPPSLSSSVNGRKRLSSSSSSSSYLSRSFHVKNARMG